jgi:hypothetical protein
MMTTKTVEEIAAEQAAKKTALELIEVQLQIARTAIEEAERLSDDYELDFEFEIGGETGYYYEGWSGWNGSNC